MRFWSGLLYAGAASAASLDACPGYQASNVQTSDSGLTADLQLAGPACNTYGTDLVNLTLTVQYETDDRIHVKIEDQANNVYQVPESVFPRPGGSSSAASNQLRFGYTASPFSFNITRASTNEILFDTSAASLVFESQYLRLRTNLPTDPYLYGLGEHSDPLRLLTTGYTRTFWNQDAFHLPALSNLYGTHPIYLEQRDTGAHGVFLLNSNGMDIVIDKTPDGKQYLEYNAVGGVFDFWFVAGPSPIEVAEQYGEVSGTPVMQPYWSLGFHQCRYGYRDAFEVAEVITNYSRAGIPLETMWTDIDYMEGRRVFTLDPDRFSLGMMREVVDHLHNNTQHYIMMVDPAVAYQDYLPFNDGVPKDAFLRHDNGSLWLGVVWPGVTVFPDWFSEDVQTYWNGEFQRFFDKDAGVDIDGLWIDMNEPSNFPCDFPCDNPFQAASTGFFPPTPPPVRQAPRVNPGWSCAFQPAGTPCQSLPPVPQLPEVAPLGSRPLQSVLDSLPSRDLSKTRTDGDRKGLPGRDLLFPKYSIQNKQGGLSNHTINTDVHHQNGLAMYDTHNMYGGMMSLASRNAMLSRRPSVRPLIITRSTFSGAGSKVGHWTGDNMSTFDHYRNSIRELLGFTAIYQFFMVGADVCGYSGAPVEELCARWASLGAFSPFYRNHKSMDDASQEFYRWDTVASSARKAIDARYRLLDYIYTAMYRSNTHGTPALLPVFYLYPQDKATWALELQYFYGPGLLVAPVTDQGSTQVQIYLPNGLFYDYFSHQPIAGEAANHTIMGQDITMIPLIIRGGVILPARANSTMTVSALRNQDFELLIPVDENGKAEGELYMDDGESLDVGGNFSLIHFAYAGGVLSYNGTYNYNNPPTVSKITLVGSECHTTPGLRSHSLGGSRDCSQTMDVNLKLDSGGTVNVVV
ncbi:alpha/beta-glucosidase agdC [Tolypocladium capitatum]|uniref:Probable alpha/beta-glucosidase agdC n=1 Tax=Tolypocladium capitatum TaxID=45235 RepID=A0A2K3QCJ3_9HYPO|nr:alpha/beta-glucosidase agdC [Tolypocladium capitatum]